MRAEISDVYPSMKKNKKSASTGMLKRKRIPLWSKYLAVSITIALTGIGMGFGVKAFIKDVQKQPPYERYILDENLAKNTKILSKDKNIFAPWKGPNKVKVSKAIELNCYFETSDGKFIGTYEYEAKKDSDGNFKLDKRGYRIVTKDNIIIGDRGYPSEKYIEEYGKKYRKIIYMICNGPTNFINQYPEIISAKEWYEFVSWFLTNVSYGPEIYDLKSFTISRGYKEDTPGVITLGGYTNKNRETPEINFYPDGFYGLSPVFTIYSAFRSSITSPYIDPSGKTEFSLEELNTTLKKVFSEVAKKTGFRKNTNHPKFSPALIQKVKTERTEEGVEVPYYKVFIEKFGGLISEVEEKYPYIFTKTNESVNYVWNNDTQEFDLKIKNLETCETAKRNKLSAKQINDECNITSLSPDRGISTALIIKTLSPDYEFNNVFLLYTAMHEYYHHFTLTNARRLSKDGVYVGAFDEFVGPSLDSKYNLETVNEYFKARNPITKAFRTKSGEIRFKVDDKVETNEEIFGSGLNQYDSEKRVFDIKQTQKNSIRGRSFRNWSDIKKLDENHLVSIILRNSFDNYSGTLNPSIIGDPTLKVLDENNNFVLSRKSLLALKKFNVRTNYRLEGFTGPVEDVEGLVNVYPVKGLFSALQDRPTQGEFEYLGEWLYETIDDNEMIFDTTIPGRVTSITDKLSLVINNFHRSPIRTYGDLGKNGRGFFYEQNKSNGMKNKYYVSLPTRLNYELYSNIILSFPMASRYTFFRDFDNFISSNGSGTLTWQDFLSYSIHQINGERKIAISLKPTKKSPRNSQAVFSNIRKWPIKSKYHAGNENLWFSIADFFEDMSKDAFILKKGEKRSVDNANPEIINIPLLKQQVEGMRADAKTKADKLLQKTYESDEAFEKRKEAIRKIGETYVRNYLYALDLLFRFIKKDVQISDGQTTNSAWETLKTKNMDNEKILNKIYGAYNEYPKWYSQIDYYERAKIVLPKITDVKKLAVSPRFYGGLDGAETPVLLKLQDGGVNSIVQGVRKSNYADELGALFSNYTTTFEENLVRDFLRSAYVPSRKQLIPEKYAALSNIQNYNITEASSGYTLYVPDSAYNILFDDKTNQDGTILREKYVFTQKTMKEIILPTIRDEYKAYYDSIIKNTVTDTFARKLEEMIRNKDSDTTISQFLYANINKKLRNIKEEVPFPSTVINQIKSLKKIDKNTVIGVLLDSVKKILDGYDEIVKHYNAILNPAVRGLFSKNGISSAQGYFTDKWSKEQMKWDLYNKDKTPAKNGATAYWNFLKEMQDIGETWITGITRKKDTDTVHFYGYFPNSKANNIKYLVFRNSITKTIHKIQLFKNVDNFFYLNKEADKNSKVNIHQQGYTSWISASFVIGKFSNAVLQEGEYDVYFEGSNGEKITAKFNRPSKTYNVTENGKSINIAPSYLLHNEKTAKNIYTKYIVRNKFGE